MEIKVALWADQSELLDDRAFRSDLHRDNVCYKWEVLKKYLSERGIVLHTFDVYDKHRTKADVYFFVNLTPGSIRYIVKRRIKRNQRLLWAVETKLVLNGLLPRQRFMWSFLEAFPGFFPVVLTYDRQHKDSRSFRFLLLPQPFFDSFRGLWEQKKDRFSAMIVGNKKSRTRGEMYSLRRVLIRFFEQHRPDAFDLYGGGWNAPQGIWEKTFPKRAFHTPLYRGTCSSKVETLSDYKFSFCPDNQRYPDYIDEKIFDSLFAGSIPVYIGATNVGDHIPEGCFVDWQKFPSYPDLVDFLQEIDESGKLEEMRNCGWDFLKSEKFFPFSMESFCETVYTALMDLKG